MAMASRKVCIWYGGDMLHCLFQITLCTYSTYMSAIIPRLQTNYCEVDVRIGQARHAVDQCRSGFIQWRLASEQTNIAGSMRNGWGLIITVRLKGYNFRVNCFLRRCKCAHKSVSALVIEIKVLLSINHIFPLYILLIEFISRFSNHETQTNCKAN